MDNLLDFNCNELTEYIQKSGHKPYRAKQLLKWIYHFGERDFSKMTDLAITFRESLTNTAKIEIPAIEFDHLSSDGTRKWLLDMGTKNGIETVFIPEENRGTLCISSQIGCALECTFCSTGRQGFNRNLTSAEIIGQLWLANNKLREQENYKLLSGDERIITNVVMMGMGEPLLNVKHVVPAMELMLDDLAFGLSKRRVTLSTSGVVPALDMLSDQIDVALAISLHAPDNALRDVLVPVNKKYPIDVFLASVKRYLAKSNANQGKVTVEYVMLNGINDSTDQAHALAKILSDTPCKINLIPFNPYPGSPYTCSSNSRIDRFSKVLMEYGLIVVVRRTRGDDIDAACGQLVGEVVDRTNRVLKKQLKGENISIKMTQ